jgi:hypothetical protein
MSIKITDVVSWKLNPSTECIELTVKLPDNTEAIVEVPETKFAEMIEMIPALEDAKKLKDLLDTLYKVRKDRLLAVDELGKECEEMTKKHEDLQKRLQGCKDKTTLFALTAESKDLGTEKVIIDTKRHLIGLLIREEGKIRADIAKQQAGRESK